MEVRQVMRTLPGAECTTNLAERYYLATKAARLESL